MRFDLKGMLGGMVVVGLVFASSDAILGLFHPRGCCPPEHQQLIQLNSWRTRIRLYCLRHRPADWDSLAAVLRDFEAASNDDTLRQTVRNEYRELVSYGSQDYWGSEIMIVRRPSDGRRVLRSYGPNRRDDGGTKDDIEVELGY